MKIGFIGLGIMGKPMAKNLLKAGYELIVLKTNRAAGELVAAGAAAGDIKEIGENCDLVLTMLPNSPQVKEVMLGENGVAAHMKEGSIYVDMSSINPVASKEVNNALDCAHTVGSPVPMTAQVQEVLQWMSSHEGGSKDHSAIAQYYEFLTGTKIGG